MPHGPFTRRTEGRGYQHRIKASHINEHSEALENTYSVDEVDDAITTEVTAAIAAIPESFGQRFDVRSYGAVDDGATDSKAAFQDAIDDAVAAGGHVWFDGAYAIAGALQVSGTTITAFGFFGASRGGSSIKQLTSNTPILNVNLTTQAHSWGIGHFTATWDGTTTTAHTAANLIHLDHTSGNFYSCWLGNITISNAYRFIDTDGQLFWGNTIAEVQATFMYGGFYELNGSAGQPNNRMVGVYVGAQQCSVTLFLGNALVMLFVGCEVNQVLGGVAILVDSGGGDYTFVGEFSCEGGTWGTNVELFQLFDSQIRMDKLKLEGTCTARVRVFLTQGTGSVYCKDFFIAILPSSSGHVYFWHVGAAGLSILADPTLYLINGRVRLGRVRFYGALANGTGIDGYNRTTNYVAPTDMGSTAAADAGQIDEWLDPARIDYAPSGANYTIGVGAPAIVIFNTSLTTGRDLVLPHTDYLFSGMRFTGVKSTSGGGGALTVKSSGGSTIGTIADASKGFLEVTFNRSIGDGPSTGFSITRGGTWS